MTAPQIIDTPDARAAVALAALLGVEGGRVEVAPYRGSGERSRHRGWVVAMVTAPNEFGRVVRARVRENEWGTAELCAMGADADAAVRALREHAAYVGGRRIEAHERAAAEYEERARKAAASAVVERDAAARLRADLGAIGGAP